MLRAIIFDCDGVLFDSERANLEFFNSVLARIGQPPLNAEGERMARGMAGPQLVAALFGAGSELALRASEVAKGLDYGPFYEWMRPVDELYETLAALKRDYRLAMATNRGMTVPGVMSRFGLDRYFDLAVGTLDVERPKPAPDMLLKCLDQFGLTPPDALYVGDTPTDAEAAAAAGVRFLGIGELSGGAAAIGELRALPAWLGDLTRL